ncbi:MAG TPA: hypothetical protein VLF79_02310 [Candidatus Saccharimonadales bacterium]|nr:hypothetical protein [Candidatus Saccharimonadales bacterium]
MFILKLIQLKRQWKVLGLIFLDGLVFGLINSNSSPAFMLVVGFILIILSLRYLLLGFLTIARLYGLSFKQKNRLVNYMTVLISFMIALQSIGELNSRDVLVMLPLIILGYLYSLYAKAPGRVPDINP